MFEDSFNLGVQVAASKYGLTRENIMAKKAAYSILDNSIEMQQLYSKAGMQLLKKAGHENSLEYKVLEKCANFPRLLSKEAHRILLKPVETYIEKKAGGFLDTTTTFMGMSSSAASLMLLSALVAGGAGGAALWGIQRAGTQEDAKTAAKFQQAKKYRQLTNEIQNEIRIKNKENKTSNINSSNQVVNTAHTNNTAQTYQF